jgi:hypothetical protein
MTTLTKRLSAKVLVEVGSVSNARAMVEAQYGKGSIFRHGLKQGGLGRIGPGAIRVATYHSEPLRILYGEMRGVH